MWASTDEADGSMESSLDTNFDLTDDTITDEFRVDLCAPCKACGVNSKDTIIRTIVSLVVIATAVLIVLCFTIWDQNTLGIVLVVVLVAGAALVAWRRKQTQVFYGFTV